MCLVSVCLGLNSSDGIPNRENRIHSCADLCVPYYLQYGQPGGTWAARLLALSGDPADL